jgi:hypothetical protein
MFGTLSEYGYMIVVIGADMMSSEGKLRISLFLLRLGVFVVMLMWTLDKFVQPDHATTVFAKFYMLEGLGRGALVEWPLACTHSERGFHSASTRL